MGWVGTKESSLQGLEGDNFRQGAQFKGPEVQGVNSRAEGYRRGAVELEKGNEGCDHGGRSQASTDLREFCTLFVRFLVRTLTFYSGF